MRIRRRLALAFVAMLVVPAVLLVGSAGIVRVVAFLALGWDSDDLVASHAVRYLEVIESVNDLILDDPDRLADPAVRAAITEGTDVEIRMVAPRPQRSLVDDPAWPPRPHDREFPIAEWRYRTSDGALRAFAIVVDVAEVGRRSGVIAIVSTLLVLLALVVTNGTLSVLVSRSILRPMAELRAAAERIGAGDLAREPFTERSDEFGALFVAFDTMRERLRGSLERQVQLEEERRAMVASLSHDLRTPITAIAGYAEGIRDGIVTAPERVRAYLDTIIERAAWAETLIGQLGAFSRLELGSGGAVEELDLDGVLRSTLADARRDVPAVTIDDSGVASGARILGDPVALRRLVENLVGNVARHCPPGTTLAVRASVVAGHAFVAFADDGPGIAAEDLPRVRERFFRGDRARTSGGGGHGLGLAIVDMIARMHGGDVQIAARPGHGTTVTLSIPVVAR